jgi:hypothetical protein
MCQFVYVLPRLVSLAATVLAQGMMFWCVHLNPSAVEGCLLAAQSYSPTHIHCSL